MRQGNVVPLHGERPERDREADDGAADLTFLYGARATEMAEVLVAAAEEVGDPAAARHWTRVGRVLKAGAAGAHSSP